MVKMTEKTCFFLREKLGDLHRKSPFPGVPPCVGTHHQFSGAAGRPDPARRYRRTAGAPPVFLSALRLSGAPGRTAAPAVK